MPDQRRDEVRLGVDGTRYAGWTQVAIRRSMKRPCHSFELTLTEAWRSAQRRPVRPGDACELSLGEERIIAGYLDDVLPEYDEEEHRITVNGRSRAGDLVDCSLPGRQWKNQTLLQIARDLAAPFGISVTAEVDIGGPFAQQTLHPGQALFDFLAQLARIRGVLLVSDAAGNLVFTRAGGERIETPLVLGENIRAANGEFSQRDRFGRYVVQSQQPASLTGNAVAAAEPEAVVVDERIDRYRPLLIEADRASDIAACRERGKWERNTRYGRSRVAVYTVDGWRHAAGTWRPNRVVPVRDHWLEIDGDRLITGVQFLLDDRGRRSEIEIMPVEAFDTRPLPEVDA